MSFKFFKHLSMVLLLLSCPLYVYADHPNFKNEIEAEYDDITLKKALDKFQDESEIPMILSPNLNYEARIRINVEKAPAFKVMKWLCEQAKIGYSFDGSAMIVETKHELLLRRQKKFMSKLVTKRHYINDLIGRVNDFIGPDISLAGGEEGAGGISIEESTSKILEPMDADDILESITDSIHPYSWDGDWGGDIQFKSGNLFVRSTPEVHDAIQKSLTELRESASLMVDVSARIYSCDASEIINFNNEIKNLVLTDKGEQLLEKFDLIKCGRNAGYSTQRFSIAMLTSQAYLRDLTAVVNVQIGELDPDIGYLQHGFVVDIRPVASFDNKSVVLELRNSFTDLTGIKQHERVDETVTHHENGEKSTHTSKRTIDLPKMISGAHRSTIKAPVNRWIPQIMGEKNGKYIVMCLKCEIIESK